MHALIARRRVISMVAFRAVSPNCPVLLTLYGVGCVTGVMWQIRTGAICWLTITKAKLDRQTSSGPTRSLARSPKHALNHTRHQFPHLSPRCIDSHWPLILLVPSCACDSTLFAVIKWNITLRDILKQQEAYESYTCSWGTILQKFVIFLMK